MVTKAQFWAILIAVLMFGSIFYLLSYGDTNQNQPPIPIDGQEPATTVSYEALNVPGKVLQIFPTAILVAKTREAQTDTIDSQLLATKKILEVKNSQFLENSDYYRAEIRVASSAGYDEVAQAVKSLESLSEAEVYPQALVSVAPKVELTNESTGLVQEQSFPGNQVAAAVLVQTRKGDDILMDIVARYQGQQLIFSFGQEKDNVSARQQLYFVNDSYTISALEDDFAFNIESTLAERDLLEDVNGALSGLDFNMETQIISNTSSFAIIFDKPFIEQDLNILFAQLQSEQRIEDYTILADQNKAIAIAPQDANLVAFRDMLSEELTILGFDFAKIQEPLYFLRGQALDADKTKLLFALKEQAGNYGLVYNVLQKARVDTNSVEVENAGTLALKEGFFTVYVDPSRKVNEDVNMALVVIASKRDGIVQISGQELKEEV